MDGTSLPRWGDPGAPLLPEALRKLWSKRPLPPWVIRELGLRDGDTAASLDADWSMSMSPSVQRFLVEMFYSSRFSVFDLPVTGKKWPELLDPLQIPWRSRTWNRIRLGGIFLRLRECDQITFGELMRIRGMGAVAMLDFASTLEAAITTMETRAENVNGNSDDSAGLAQEVLDNALDYPWLEQVSHEDSRFSGLVPPNEGTLFDMLDLVTSSLDSESLVVNERSVARAIEAASKVVDHLAGMSLERVLREFLVGLSGYSGARLNAFLARFGWGGEPGITLEKTGAMMRVTRERARQLQKRILERFPSHRVVMPALDSAINALANAAPIDVEAASRLLADEGISEHPFHPVCVIKAAKDFGRDVFLKIVTVNKRQIVTADAAGELMPRLIAIALAQIRASGATNVLEVLAEAEAQSLAVDERQIKKTIAVYREFETLNNDWFWRPSFSRLENLSRKMLAVASPIDVAVLREGIRREYRFRRTRSPKGWHLVVPPRDVLTSIYRGHPSFVLAEDNLVRPVNPLDYRSELSPNEQILVDVFRSSPVGVLDREGMRDGCRARGMNPHSMSVLSSYSAVLAHLGPDLWTLRGVCVDPAAVEALREANAARPRLTRVQDYGWTDDGRLWIAFRLPCLYENLLLYVPSAVRHLLPTKDYAAETERGRSCGRVRIYRQGQCAIPQEFLTRSGADADDLLITEFDLARSVVSLRIENDEVLEDLAPE